MILPLSTFWQISEIHARIERDLEKVRPDATVEALAVSTLQSVLCPRPYAKKALRMAFGPIARLQGVNLHRPTRF